MGGYGDALALEQQEQLDQQQAAANSRLYNPDGSWKANDFTPPALPETLESRRAWRAAPS